LVANKHAPTVFKRVDDYSPGVAESDLECGVFVLLPPVLAYCGVVIAESEEVADHGQSTGNLRQAFDM
jgi:hypothetical protein